MLNNKNSSMRKPCSKKLQSPLPNYPDKNRIMKVDIGRANESFHVMTNSEGLWISDKGGWPLENFKLIDPLRGTPGIPQSTIRTIEYSLILRSKMPFGVSSGSGVFGLQDHVQKMVKAFTEVSSEANSDSSRHHKFTEAAFRGIVRETFGMSYGVQYSQNDNHSTDKSATKESVQLRDEAWRQADIFADAFFENFRTHGAEGAFNIAWTMLQYA